MAATGFTPIQLYYSSTATNTPIAGNLANGELAINITDGKLFYKDNANAIQVIGWKVSPATAGGTGLTSFAVGDLIYADTTTTLAKLADVATGNALISGGVGVAPSYGKIGLTTHISGTLPVANGGTNLTSYTTGDIVYASASGTLASLADVATGNALISGGVGVAPSYGKVGLTTHVSGTLPVANGGTGQTSYTDGQLLIGNTTGNTLTKATLTAGTNVTITNAGGSITIAASGGGGSAATPTALGTVYGSTDNASIAFIGYQAGNSNSTGTGNTALGYRAGYSNTTSNTSTYIGRNAGYYSTGTANTFVGEGAGYGGAGTFSGKYNTVIGQGAGTSLTTGEGNCFVGGAYGNSGYFVSSGSYNTILGGYNGNQGSLDIRTSNSNIVLSDGIGNIGARWVNGGGWYQLNNSSSWSTTSDARIKENIVDVTRGLEIIMALRPVEFDYILNKQHATGFIAQEYETVLPDQIIEDVNITDELKALTNGEPVKAIQQNLVPYLVKAIQELKAEIDQLKGK